MIASFFGKTGICPIIETVVFLGRQNIPLRSDRDDASRGAWPPGPPAFRHSTQSMVRWVIQGDLKQLTQAIGLYKCPLANSFITSKLHACIVHEDKD